MRFIVTVLLFELFSFSCFAQCDPALKNYIEGFSEIEASAFSFLENSLNDVRIVGYGEDTHGTAEFTILAEKLMEYLSEKHNFKILILETSFGEGQYLNDYIQGKRDDLTSILKDINSTWRYRTQSFYHLMNGLKSYNQSHPDKIHLYGCEMHYVVSEINRIRAYLAKVGSNYQLDDFGKSSLYQNFEEHEKTDYFIAYAKLKNHFIDNFEDFKTQTSEAEFNEAYQNIVVLGQFVTAINQHQEQRKHDFRDIYMAENIQWIMNVHGHKSKALYWAHNEHIGDWVGNGIVDVAGHQLRKLYGNQYFNIATDFGTGTFLAFPADAHQTGNWRIQTFEHNQILENTFSDCLKSYGNPNTFLNVRQARTDSTLIEFLHTDWTTMSGAGAQARNNNTETRNIGEAFDGIIYLNKTNKITWKE